jgi:hypothetical protein
MTAGISATDDCLDIEVVEMRLRLVEEKRHDLSRSHCRPHASFCGLRKI